MAEDEQLKGLPAQLRMNAIATHGGTTKARFESYSLAASIVGKCHFCVKAHYDTLKKEGYSVEQLRDIGRIAAVVNSVAKVLNS
jgi:alkyl hydroperoxide reductase subunit D